MSKVLTDLEVLEIIESAIKGNEIDDGEHYMGFLADLGHLIAEHFGGYLGCVSEPLTDNETFGDASNRYCIHFQWDECVPEDGGVFMKYDADVTLEEWRGE